MSVETAKTQVCVTVHGDGLTMTFLLCEDAALGLMDSLERAVEALQPDRELTPLPVSDRDPGF